MEEITISVILPVYNAANSVGQCIESILAQTFVNFELIIIDDGSRDETGMICDKYANIDSRIVVFHQQNCGVSVARNKGIENCNGKYIAFCDSDDWVGPNWLEDFIEEEDVDMLVQGFYCKEKEGKEKIMTLKKGEYYDKDFGRLSDKLYKSGNDGFLWCRLFRKDIIKSANLKFESKLKLREDKLFIFQYMAHSKRIVLSDKLNYHYSIPNFTKKYLADNSYEDFLCTYEILSISRYWGAKELVCHEALRLHKNIKIVSTLPPSQRCELAIMYWKGTRFSDFGFKSIKLFFLYLLDSVMVLQFIYKLR